MLDNTDGGAIVNIDTMAGVGPCSYVGNVYAASRYAITGLTINTVLHGAVLSYEDRGHVEQFAFRHPIGRPGCARRTRRSSSASC